MVLENKGEWRTCQMNIRRHLDCLGNPKVLGDEFKWYWKEHKLTNGKCAVTREAKGKSFHCFSGPSFHPTLSS